MTEPIESRRRAVASMVVLLIAGALLSWRTVIQADRQMREDLLWQTSLLAQAMDVDRIQGLSGSETDRENPYYQRIKKQFAAAQRASDAFESINLMGRGDDGTLLFFLDNGPLSAEEEPPSVRTHEAVPAWMYHVFETGRGDTKGPYTDQRGTFVAALVPIVDPNTNAVIAALGADIDARDWTWGLARAATPPVFLTAALIAILFVGEALSARRARLANEAPRWMRHLESILVAASGLTLTVFAAWTAHQNERQGRYGAFAQLAASRTLAIAESLRDLHHTELEGLARFYQGSEYVTPEEFHRYTGYLTRNPIVQAWAWVPIVPAADKSRFEHATRQDGLQGFEIWQTDAQGRRVPAAAREVHYPISRLAPIVGNEQELGYDLGSEPSCRTALNEAVRTGLATSADPVPRLHAAVDPNKLVVVRSVWGGDHPGQAQGFVLATLRMDKLLASAAPDLSATHLEIAFLRPDGSFEQLATTCDVGTPVEAAFSLTRPVLAFGKVFAIGAHADETFLRLHPARAGWLTMLTGVVLTAATALVLGMVLHRRTVLKQMVDERTAQLRESEALLRIAGRTAQFGGWIADLARQTVVWSEEVAVIHDKEPGYSPTVAEGIQYYAPEWRERIARVFEACARDGTPYDEEMEIITAKGRRRWVRTRAEAVRDSSGTIVRVQGAIQDITDWKKADEERERLQSQLTHAQKMESIGRLAGGVAHDFNNMLSVILGHTEMAMEQVDPTRPLHADLAEIRAAANRSAEITRQLLAFARKQTMAPKVLDLNETVEGMLKMLRRLIGEDIDLSWQPGEGLGWVRMDPSQIDQVLANLCVNARDAIADVGKITIETANAAFDEAYCAEHADFVPGEYVLLAVSDDGCGMDKATLANLFEPFYTTKEVGKGTGLGLATVYGIVRQNDGFINVYSEPGHGTCFTIYLPRHPGEKKPSGRKADSAASGARGQETILLVEDEPAILKMVTMMLEHLGYAVLAASSPSEAIRLAESHADSIDLLMTDVVMPEMNGRDLAANLVSRYPGLRCLFTSGYTANVIAHHGVLDPAVHFIQKPFTLDELAAKVRRLLDPG